MSLQHDLRASKDKVALEQEEYRVQSQKQARRIIADLEREKSELANRLNSVIGNLEKKTQSMIEEANSKLYLKTQMFEEMEKQNLRLKEELEKVSMNYFDFREKQLDIMQQKDATVEKIWF